MQFRISKINWLLILSLSFTFLLLLIRIVITNTITYSFYFWNIFLALVPFVFSYKLSKHEKIDRVSVLLFICWLLFFPNAFYILTDIFHYKERHSAPKWYDLILVFSATYNGLLLGVFSLLQVEIFLKKVFTPIKKTIAVVSILILSSYGIYIGRYLRYNSWDIVTNPDDVLFTTAHYFIKPWQHIYAWGFIVLFTMLLAIIYFSFKNITTLKIHNSK